MDSTSMRYHFHNNVSNESLVINDMGLDLTFHQSVRFIHCYSFFTFMRYTTNDVTQGYTVAFGILTTCRSLIYHCLLLERAECGLGSVWHNRSWFEGLLRTRALLFDWSVGHRGSVLIALRGHCGPYDTQTYLLRCFLSQAKPYILPGILVMYARQSFQPRQ